MQKDAGLSADAAAAKVRTDTGFDVELYKDFIKVKNSAANNDATKDKYAKAHEAAKVLVNSLKLNAAELKGEMATGDKMALQG